ncbi:MAG: nucleotidyltransferase family protein [Candidatus Tectomicrobia bacterium]|nr:nucleotidyltransferase family protein [Candidatus Tectomicrobia bacterium]
MPHRTSLQLLRRAARVQPLPPPEVRRLCAAVQDWREVLDLAGDHGLQGLLYRQCREVLRRTAALNRPFSLLRAAYYGATATTLHLMHVLGVVAAAAAEAKCSFLPIQGALLQALYYPDPGLRPMEDLDLLVLPGSYQRFRRVLRSCGFQRLAPDSATWVRGAAVIDLHRHVVNVERLAARGRLWRFSTMGLWQRARAMPGYPASVRFLCPTDTILALTAHTLKHGFKRLIWVADLRLVLERHLGGSEPEITWEEVLGEARAVGGERAFCYLLQTLRLGLGERLPAVPQSWLDRQAPFDGVERRFLLGVARLQPLPRLGDVMLAYGSPSRRQRLRLLVEACFPHPSALAANYPWLPRPLFALAYLLRMLRLSGFAIDALWRLHRR